MKYKAIEDALNKKVETEKIHKKDTDKLKYGRTDVLYSFRGLYALGLYIYDKDDKLLENDKLFELSNTKIIPKNRDNNRQTAYSNTWLLANYSNKEFHELNDFFEKNYLVICNDIGNLIPVWPGANVDRGLSQCYDLPMIYFAKYSEMTELFYKQDHIQKFDKKLMNKFAKSKITLDNILSMSKDDYNEFIKGICETIKQRTNIINKILDKKTPTTEK